MQIDFGVTLGGARLQRGDPGAEKLKAVLQSKFAKQYVNLNLPGTSTNRPTDQQMRVRSRESLG